MTDLRGLKAILDGLQKGKGLAEVTSEQKEALSAALTSMVGKLNSMLDSLIAQAILSQPSKNQGTASYLYHQVPNSLTVPPQTVEVIIKRDGSSSRTIDPSNTQIVMSLETPNLGKMAVVMDVKEKKLKILFNTEDEDTRKLIVSQSAELKEKLADKNYITTSFQAKVNKPMCSIKPYLIPLFKIDDLFRVDLMA